VLWELFSLPKIVSSFSPDWIWCLGNYGFKRPVCHQSLLFHDSHLIYPASKFGDVSRWYRFKKWLLKRKLQASLSATSTVYCQTNTVRQGFHNAFKFPVNQIAICPGAFSLPKPSNDLPESIKDQSFTNGLFRLLYVSSCSGHKNHRILLEVFQAYREELSDVVCFLTIDPEENARALSIVNGISDRSLERQLIPIGHLEARQIARCYGEMDALVFPSLLETVGLPLIEAMQFDLPIIVSDLDFAHEICGPAAEYVDPTSVESIKNGILKLKFNTVRCTELSQLGKERINTHFKTWPDILRDVLDNENIEHQ
jgi:glycosyltransferase involved in cell wall biosynthesis